MTGTRSLALGVVLALLPQVAHAHTPIEGMGDFYSGMLHPWVVPPHILTILATGFLLGQRGQRCIEAGLAAFVASILLGLAAAGYGVGGPPEVVLLSLAALLGVTVAALPTLPRTLCVVLAATTGLLVGADSAPDAPSLRATLFGLGGTGLGATLAIIYAAGLVEFLKQPWQRIGVRVVGSWIAASAILVLALALAGPIPPR